MGSEMCIRDSRREVEAGEREQELVARLVAVEQQTAELVQEVARVRGEQEDLAVGRKAAKVAAKVAGEKLMRLLESLDNLSLDKDMVELRARRKRAASRINKIMDKNDANLQVVLVLLVLVLVLVLRSHLTSMAGTPWLGRRQAAVLE